MNTRIILFFSLCFLIAACETEERNPPDDRGGNNGGGNNGGGNTNNLSLGILEDKIDLSNIGNYANQPIPTYIQDDNTENNDISNIEALLGRVLFYDKNLSSDRSVSCASCHKQEFAFGDNDVLSQGVNGLTGKQSMRLVNARFSNERRFFWDERARSLEEQTTMPIRDHAEMGFSGANGDQDFNDLINRLSAIDYYQLLFQEAFGNDIITEQRMQAALAQFIRSIQSFDSKYDEGRFNANNNNQNFGNFTNLENMGKQLFMQEPQFNGQSGNRVGGGLGCNACHTAPEFDIRPNSRNNGVIGVMGAFDTDVTRSPTLRNLFNSNGVLNTPMMHTGDFSSMQEVLSHYNEIRRVPGNNNLDQRLARGGGVSLNMTNQEKQAVIAFLRTLSGTDVYNNDKWSDPFE